MSYVEMAIVKR